MPENKQPPKQGAKKKKKKRKSKRKDSHYCRVCGEHKANEKFSGKGHATHICKKCQGLSVSDRNELTDVTKIGNMSFRHLSEQEIKWLRKKMNDPRPEVQEAARMAHSFKFPHYERNIIKKGLTARSMEFFIHGDIWSDDFCDEIPVHMRFFLDESGVFRRIDYSAPEGEQETTLKIGQAAAKTLLKAIVHRHNAAFWSEDLGDGGGNYDPDLDVLSEYWSDYGEPGEFDFALFVDEEDEKDESDEFDFALFVDDDDESETPDDDREPLWSIKLMLTNGIGEKTQTFYNSIHREAEELFWELIDWFEPEDELNDEDFDDLEDDE